MRDHWESRDYYVTGGVEAMDAIEAWGLNFARGCVVKYLARAGRKPGGDELDDLRKARFYLDREIRRVEGTRHPEPDACQRYAGEEQS